ncbi:YoaK family protein [Corallococcus sp. EGB]|uniref:YoaK family protein n=1 Tax=Corallococcus sp. EGB TaxID=1521117 RepID=UPI001CBF0C12|nr:YoaK family protein [Corallococcus sp. EGB]
MFSAQSSPQSRRAYSRLAVLLASVAGAVNAVGFVALGAHASHMSGNMATLGESLAQGRWSAARLPAQLMALFVAGAFCATALLDASRHRTRGRHVAALLLEALVLGGVGVGMESLPGTRAPALLWGIAFAMGLQNALVTRVSGAVVRTTHVTGLLTDIGIQLVQMLAWVRDGLRGDGAPGLWQRVRELPSAVQFERTRLHLGLALAFLAGSTLGPYLFLRHGAVTLVLPCAVLGVLAALDVRLTVKPAPSSSAAPGH